MVRRYLILGGTILTLAACQNGSSPLGNGGLFSGSSSNTSGYGGTTAQETQQGCASGQQADVLHQNRPGGSDYSMLRCHTKGY